MKWWAKDDVVGGWPCGIRKWVFRKAFIGLLPIVCGQIYFVNFGFIIVFFNFFFSLSPLFLGDFSLVFTSSFFIQIFYGN